MVEVDLNQHTHITKRSIVSALSYFENSDQTLSAVFKSIDDISPPKRDLSFSSLVKIIISQQLSGAAANTIFNRLQRLLDQFYPEEVLDLEIKLIRECGVSTAKIGFIKQLASRCHDDKGYLTSFMSMSNEQVLHEIKTNKGIGEWSSYIFMLFCLKRIDIFPKGDATLLGAISDLYGCERKDHEKIEQISSNWAPYRSVASLGLWGWVDAGRPKITA